MLYIAICLCLVACAFGAPTPTDVVPLEKQQPTVIPIVSQSDELEPNGTYHFSYETGNGIKRDEIAYDKKVPKAQGRSADSNEGGENDSDEIHVQIGSYSYTAPDGTLISVRYIADENGFQPIGDHIPKILSASASSSAEKSGRSLSPSDSAASGSAPETKASKPVPPAVTGALQSRSAGTAKETSTTSSSTSSEGSSTPAFEASSEETSTKSPESNSSTSEASSGSAASTTEAVNTEASTSAGTLEGSTTQSTSSEASTTAEASSTTKTDQAEPSTTTVATSTLSAEASTTTLTSAAVA